MFLISLSPCQVPLHQDECHSAVAATTFWLLTPMQCLRAKCKSTLGAWKEHGLESLRFLLQHLKGLLPLLWLRNPLCLMPAMCATPALRLTSASGLPPALRLPLPQACHHILV